MLSNIFTTSLWGAWLYLFVFAVQANEPPLSIFEAAEQAALQAPSVQAQTLRLSAAQADVQRAGRLPDPELILGVDGVPVQGSHAFETDYSDMTTRKMGISFTLPAGDKRQAEQALASAAVLVGETTWQAIQLASQQAGATAWIELWAAQQELALLQELIEPQTWLANSQTAQFAGGTGSAQAALAAALDTMLLQDRLDEAQLRVQTAEAKLARWLPEASNRPLAQAPDFSILPTSQEELLANLNKDFALRNVDAQLGQAQAAASLAQAEQKSDWRVGVYYGQREHFDDLIGVEIGLSLPFFQRKNQRHNLSARLAERSAIEADRRHILRERREQLTQTLALWQSRGQQVKRFQNQLLPLAADRSAVALASWQGGGNQQDWLNARQDEINLRIRFAQTLAAPARK